MTYQHLHRWITLYMGATHCLIFACFQSRLFALYALLAGLWASAKWMNVVVAGVLWYVSFLVSGWFVHEIQFWPAIAVVDRGIVTTSLGGIFAFMELTLLQWTESSVALMWLLTARSSTLLFYRMAFCRFHFLRFSLYRCNHISTFSSLAFLLIALILPGLCLKYAFYFPKVFFLRIALVRFLSLQDRQ